MTALSVMICPQCKAVTRFCAECKAVEGTPHLDGCVRQHAEDYVGSPVTMADLRRSYDG